MINMHICLTVLSYNGIDVSKRFLNFFHKNTDLSKVFLLWVDNGSSDNTVDYVNKFAKDNNISYKLIENDENLGVIKGRNIGFEYFKKNKKFSHLMFLDNDQFVQPNWLDEYERLFNEGYNIVGVEAWRMSRTFLPKEHLEPHQKKSFHYVGCGGMCMSREVVDKIGGFDERYGKSYFEDPSLCFEAVREGFKIGWNKSETISHLPHQTLGNDPDKNKNFLNSLKEFRKKWKGEKLIDITQ